MLHLPELGVNCGDPGLLVGVLAVVDLESERAGVRRMLEGKKEGWSSSEANAL